MDPRGSEISLETGLKAEAVSRHYYSPGGASNIAANLVALKPAEILSIGVIGNDIYGRELKRQLNTLNINTSYLISQKENFDTYVFTKRILDEEEEPRIDFGIYNKRSIHTDKELLDGIMYALENYDVLIFNQQVPWSISNDTFINEANKLFRKYDDKIVLLDSRHYNIKFKNVYRKLNDIELSRINKKGTRSLEESSLEEIFENLINVFERKPIFVTCGERGIVSIDTSGVHHTPGIQLMTKLDTVGAGDTTMSALACCLGAKIIPEEAAIFANLAAAVTVQKLFITGTANGQEILEISNNPDYIFNVDLANDISLANYHQGTDIEICNSGIIGQTQRVKHIVFDHDGTLSILRRGWDVIMQEMMIESITGGNIQDEKAIERIRKRVVDYINQSTGVQTILQMEMLVELVREFNLIEEDAVLDRYAYKSIFSNRLLQIVNKRLEVFQSKHSQREKYMIKGSVEILKGLKDKGILLYLASGTDIENVKHEASILGYADYFEGRIYGSVDDVSKFSKKLVIGNIIKDNQLQENEFAVIGDGPVEIREGKRMNGIAIGVASNEEVGYDLNLDKRKRLIKAGADIIISDYLQSTQLLDFLFGS
jgi:sugar/nucleoside kinase (ribokinase family)/phosphoglycolate phosphatase-like HAD superfamily hydrolase